MGQPFIGEIRMFGGNFAPAGWMFCEGQTLPISENVTFFSARSVVDAKPFAINSIPFALTVVVAAVAALGACSAGDAAAGRDPRRRERPTC